MGQLACETVRLAVGGQVGKPMGRRLEGTRHLCVLVDTYQGIKAPRELKRLEGLGTTSACHYAVAKAPIS